jgi:glutamate dehydrogenase
MDMLIEGRRLVERASRLLVHADPRRLDVEAAIAHFGPGTKELAAALPDRLQGLERDAFDARKASLTEAGVPDDIARRVAAMPALLAALDIVTAADATGCDQDRVTDVHFRVGAQLELNWLRDRIVDLPRANRWQSLGRTALRDELLALHRALTEEILRGAENGSDAQAAIDSWRESNRGAVDRCLGMLADIRASRTFDITTLPVALREVRHLIRGGAESDGRGDL